LGSGNYGYGYGYKLPNLPSSFIDVKTHVVRVTVVGLLQVQGLGSGDSCTNVHSGRDPCTDSRSNRDLTTHDQYSREEVGIGGLGTDDSR
jgi:hypothetical protein